MTASRARRSALLVAASTLLAGLAPTTTASAVEAPPRPTSTVTGPSERSTGTTAPRIRSLTVSVSKGVVTMPSRLAAGTYYMHVTTTDASAELQVVRPPSALSLQTWYARDVACRTHSSGETWETSLRQCRYWRTSATFVGGAEVDRVRTAGALPDPRARATFAITLAPGRYWFYQSDYGSSHPVYGGTSLARSTVRVITVTGATERAPVPVAAVARFLHNTPSMPRVIPRRGFVLGIGEPGVVTHLYLFHLKPGVSDSDLVPSQCFPDSGGAYQALQCFDTVFHLGGGVSAGASALWWYDLPPGEYIAFQGGLNEASDTGLDPTPKFARVTVQ